MIDTKKILGDNLKRIRKDMGYSQEKLSEILGIQRNTVSYIETATKNNISFDTLNKICTKLNISPIELFLADKPEYKNEKIHKLITILSSMNDEKLDYAFKIINAIK